MGNVLAKGPRAKRRRTPSDDDPTDGVIVRSGVLCAARSGNHEAIYHLWAVLSAALPGGDPRLLPVIEIGPDSRYQLLIKPAKEPSPPSGRVFKLQVPADVLIGDMSGFDETFEVAVQSVSSIIGSDAKLPRGTEALFLEFRTEEMFHVPTLVAGLAHTRIAKLALTATVSVPDNADVFGDIFVAAYRIPTLKAIELRLDVNSTNLEGRSLSFPAPPPGVAVGALVGLNGPLSCLGGLRNVVHTIPAYNVNETLWVFPRLRRIMVANIWTATPPRPILAFGTSLVPLETDLDWPEPEPAQKIATALGVEALPRIHGRVLSSDAVVSGGQIKPIVRAVMLPRLSLQQVTKRALAGCWDIILQDRELAPGLARLPAHIQDEVQDMKEKALATVVGGRPL